MKEVLMCQPTAFDVVYAINPCMQVNNKPNKTLALKQWQNLYDTYQKLGVKINLIEQGEMSQILSLQQTLELYEKTLL